MAFAVLGPSCLRLTLPCRLTLLQESSAALIRDLPSIVLLWVVLHHPLPGWWIFTPPRAFTSGSSQPASEYESPYRNLVFQSQTIAHIIPAPACSFLCALDALQLQSCPLIPPLTLLIPLTLLFRGSPGINPFFVFMRTLELDCLGLNHRSSIYNLGNSLKLSEPHSLIKMGAGWGNTYLKRLR